MSLLSLKLILDVIFGAQSVALDKAAHLAQCSLEQQLTSHGSPEHTVVTRRVPSGVRSVALDKAAHLAQILATRSETAICMWTPHMRSQLIEFISAHEGKGVSEVRGFIFKALQHELCIAGVYLRTIVNVPDALSTVTNAGRLAHCILCFLAANCPEQPQGHEVMCSRLRHFLLKLLMPQNPPNREIQIPRYLAVQIQIEI